MGEDKTHIVHALARKWPMTTIKVLLGTIALLLGLIGTTLYWGGSEVTKMVMAKLIYLEGIGPRFEKIELNQQVMHERQDRMEKNIFDLARSTGNDTPKN